MNLLDGYSMFRLMPISSARQTTYFVCAIVTVTVMFAFHNVMLVVGLGGIHGKIIDL